MVTIKEKTLELKRSRDKYTFCIYFFSILILRFLSMLPTFPLRIFFKVFNTSFFLRDRNGNKAVQLFWAIPVAVDFLIGFFYFCNSITIL